MTATDSAPATEAWDKQLEQLKARYKHVRPPILVALNILLHNADVSVDDAKAQAQLRGMRITAASINAAKALLARMNARDIAAEAARAPAAAPAPTRPARRPRATDKPVDAESLIRGVVTKLQTQGNVEADRSQRTRAHSAIAAPKGNFHRRGKTIPSRGTS